MKRNKFIASVLMFCLGFVAVAAMISQESEAQKSEPTASLNDHLRPFAPFLGKTWKGKSTDSKPDKPVYDVSRWERALNGQAVRILHSVNNGEYGGETIVMWDSKKESLVFFYFTTAGFYTTGTMKVEKGKFISHEYVTGNASGITEVKATGTLLPDGRLHTKSRYLQNGEWVDGHEFVYVEDPKAQVIFR